MTGRLAAAAFAAVLVAPAAGAHAHAVMRATGDTLAYSARDDVSPNVLVLALRGGDLRFEDPGSIGGIRPAPACAPDAVDGRSGDITAVLCPRAGVRRIHVDTGEAQDVVAGSSVPVALRVRAGAGADSAGGSSVADAIAGGAGNDTLFGNGGADAVAGGAGDDIVSGDADDDVLTGGPGTDGLYGGAGADTLLARDGELDEVACGAGSDRLVADQFDTVIEPDSCEAIEREVVPAAQAIRRGDRFDRSPPLVRAGGLALQPLRGRSLEVLATMSEAGRAVAAGYVQIRGGRRYLLLPARATVAVDGGGATLRLRLVPAAARRVRRALARGGSAVATVDVVGTDASGNAAPATMRVRLRRG